MMLLCLTIQAGAHTSYAREVSDDDLFSTIEGLQQVGEEDGLGLPLHVQHCIPLPQHPHPGARSTTFFFT